MNVPIWDSWLWFGDTFTSLFKQYRTVYLGGPFGTGKSVMALFLGSYLIQQKLSARIIAHSYPQGYKYE